ncbi:MAG: sugar ABC transporter permease [Eubacteriales bacterium]|nr:sugar ABC transporter permease [Eubacteriales bacterium]
MAQTGAKSLKAAGKRGSSLKYIIRRDWMAWCLMIPTLALFVFFAWMPLIEGLVLSFFRTKGYDIVKFIGFANYREVIADRAFVAAFVNCFKYLGWSLILGFCLPIIVAIMINEVVHGGSVMRVSIYFPSMVPGVAVALMWTFLLDPGAGGLVNSFLKSVGLPMSQMLQDPKLTIPLIVMTMTWKGFGGTAIMYLASLQGVNQELYEAAIMDGAGIFKRIFHITLPSIYPIISLMFIMQIIGVFQVMYEPMMMTSGGPNNASMSLLLLGYQYGFTYMKAGHSMAVSSITFVIILALVMVYFRVQKHLEKA